MKKIFATILVLSLASAIPGIAQSRNASPASQQVKPTDKKVKTESKTQKGEQRVVPVQKAENKMVKPEVKPAKPDNKVTRTKQTTTTTVVVSAAKVEPVVVKTEVLPIMMGVKAKPKYDTAVCFPLKRDDIYSLYTYVIDLRDIKIINKYKPMFDLNNYEFTGYVWQSLLKQMINNADDKIMHNVFIKAEDDLVYFTITRFDVKHELPEYICPILESPQLFASYVRKANRRDVNNY